MSLIHTCYRILDIDRSVAFYKALGFTGDRAASPIRDEAINVFMGLPEDGDEPAPGADLQPRSAPSRTRSAPATATSRSPPRTSTARSQRLAEQGIEPEKPPYTIREGGSRLCFVRDPDGYRIEIIERG